MIPILTSYDWIVVNSSGGKESQCMLDYIVEMARVANILDRVVVVHADLGRVEWEGAKELAEEHAKHYDLRFEWEKRPQGDLLQQVRERGMWPSSKCRYCTSDHKRGQVKKILTRLVREKWNPSKREPVRILNCLGLRAQESPKRAKDPHFKIEDHNNGRREIHTWLPIQQWKLEEVLERNKRAGTQSHWVYAKGMPRLSCSFCVFAPKPALMLAAQLRPALFQEYLQVEREIGHTFKHGL